MYYCFLILFVFLPQLGQSQDALLRVNEELSITRLMDHRKALNFQKDRKIKAWSVQILLTRDKYLATKRVSEIKKMTLNIGVPVDWFYEAPYYRIFAGAFYTKIEAVELLHKLLDDFPEAIIFKNAQSNPGDL